MGDNDLRLRVAYLICVTVMALAYMWMLGGGR